MSAIFLPRVVLYCSTVLEINTYLNIKITQRALVNAHSIYNGRAMQPEPLGLTFSLRMGYRAISGRCSRSHRMFVYIGGLKI